MAKLICIEGPDRHGKHTQSLMLANRLRDAYSLVPPVIEVPYKNGAGALTHWCIYWMLNNGLAKRFPNAFQLVQFMNKLSFQLFTLPRLMKKDRYVVVDRWALSGIVYGDATGANKRFTRMLFGFLKKPDITIVLSGSSFSRDKKKDDYEADTDLQKAVKRGYWNWAMDHREDHELVGNRGDVATTENVVMCTLIHRGIVDDWMQQVAE